MDGRNKGRKKRNVLYKVLLNYFLDLVYPYLNEHEKLDKLKNIKKSLLAVPKIKNLLLTPIALLLLFI